MSSCDLFESNYNTKLILPLQQSMQQFCLKKNETPYLGYLNGSYGTALQNITVINDNKFVLPVAITSQFFPHSWLITVFVTRVTRRMTLDELHTAYQSRVPEFIPCFKWYLRFHAIFCGSSFLPVFFSFGHCIVCPSSIYDFCLPLLYLQTFPTSKKNLKILKR